MRIILLVLVLAFILAACGTTPGVPTSQQPLGDELAQITFTTDVVPPDPDGGEMIIRANLGVSSCNIASSQDAEGKCDIPAELRCDGAGKRICGPDCSDYLENYNDGCLKDWMRATYDKPFSVDADFCFLSEADYMTARASSYCQTGDDDITTGACTGTCSFSCSGTQNEIAGECPFNRVCCVEENAPTTCDASARPSCSNQCLDSTSVEVLAPYCNEDTDTWSCERVDTLSCGDNQYCASGSCQTIPAGLVE